MTGGVGYRNNGGCRLGWIGDWVVLNCGHENWLTAGMSGRTTSARQSFDTLRLLVKIHRHTHSTKATRRKGG